MKGEGESPPFLLEGSRRGINHNGQRLGTLFTVSTDQIIIDRDTRQRREIETEDLEASIRQRGLIQPIIVEPAELPGYWKLIAGERRLTACRNIGWTEIEARSVEDLTVIERELLELEENIKRQDLTWQEITRAVAKVHCFTYRRTLTGP